MAGPRALRVFIVALLIFLTACASPQTRVPQPPSESPSAPPSPSPSPDPVEKLIAVGDIASCKDEGDEQTAQLVDGLEGSILVLGDLAYDRGTRDEFRDCYRPSWGRHLLRTHPVPGNHEYGTPGAAPYFEFFSERAGKPGEGWYSFKLGSWHVIALNSNCGAVGCKPGSSQETWLRSDLASPSSLCTLAFWHHPRFTSGKTHGDNLSVAPFWNVLHESGAEVVLSGHEHNYERFGPLGPNGNPDPTLGIRQFVVGTGGRSLYPLETMKPGSESQSDTAHGVLTMTLRHSSYEWRFIPVGGGAPLDVGEGACH